MTFTEICDTIQQPKATCVFTLLRRENDKMDGYWLNISATSLDIYYTAPQTRVEMRVIVRRNNINLITGALREDWSKASTLDMQ